MLKQIDEPLFPVIAVDSSPATPVPSPPMLRRCGGRNVRGSELSPGGWSLRHAETKCLGQTQVDTPRSACGSATDEPGPVEPALPPTQTEKPMNATTPQSPLVSPSHESKPMEAALPSTPPEKPVDDTRPESPLASPSHESELMSAALLSTPPEKLVDGATPQFPLAPLDSKSPQSPVPPAQPEPTNTVDTQDCYIYCLPLLCTYNSLGFRV